MKSGELKSLILLILLLPLLFRIAAYAGKVGTMDSDASAEEASDILVDAATPWWLAPFEWLSNLKGTLGVFILTGFVIFVAWLEKP